MLLVSSRVAVLVLLCEGDSINVRVKVSVDESEWRRVWLQYTI